MVARRAAGIGFALAGLAGFVLAAGGYRWDAVVLTGTAAVGIINALWLEGLLLRVLQPAKPRFSRAAVFILLGRFGLWALLFGVLYLLRRHVSIWAVVGGLGCFLVALAAAGVSGRPDRAGEE